jgi:hypothetical protein
LVLSGLFTTRDTNRLLAAEQMLAGAIRQARHTARSSGSPVELRLTPTLSGSEVIGAKLGGVSRVCLWSETFDKERDTDDDGVIDVLEQLPEPGVVVGRSGNGRQPNIAGVNFPILPHELTRGSTLVRGSRTDGFYLACSVFLPTQPSGKIPLLLIGDNDDPRTCQCQLAVKESSVIIQGTAPDPIAKVRVWDLVGVIHDDSGEVAVHSTLDAVVSRMKVEKFSSGDNDIPHPILGGRWIDVGLLYDGQRMILYCDGERIAQLAVGNQSQLVANGNFIFVGSMLDVNATPQSPLYANASLDDARLYRLGTADLGELPGNVVLTDTKGVKSNLGYRILCQPDGRVEVSRDDAVDGNIMNDPLSTNPNHKVTTGSREGERATITIGQLRTPSALQAAEITVTLDGRVTSRLLTHAQAVAPK